MVLAIRAIELVSSAGSMRLLAIPEIPHIRSGCGGRKLTDQQIHHADCLSSFFGRHWCGRTIAQAVDEVPDESFMRVFEFSSDITQAGTNGVAQHLADFLHRGKSQRDG